MSVKSRFQSYDIQKVAEDRLKIIEEDENLPDNIFYNVVMHSSGTQSQGFAPQAAQFSEQRTIPIVQHPDKYFMSLIRFSVPVSLIPLFIMPIQPFPNTNANLSLYSVTLSYNGTNFQTSLIYTPWDPVNPTPAGPSASSPNADPNNPYYWVFQVQHMLDIINTALATSFAALKVAFPAAAATQAPYFKFDPVTQLFSLVAQSGAATYSYDPSVLTAPVNTIEIWTDFLLYSNFFSGSFDGNLFGYENAANGKGFRYAVESLPLGAAVPDNGYAKPYQTAAPATAPYLIMTQQFSTLPLWSGFKSIVFLTGTVPVLFENTSSTFAQLGTSSGIQQPILTDFEPIITQNVRTIDQYFAPGEYRLSDLRGHAPLTHFDISVYWRDNQGVLHPLLIPPGDNVTIKILFRRKSLYRAKSAGIL